MARSTTTTRRALIIMLTLGKLTGFSFRRNGQWMARIRKERRGGRNGQYFRLRYCNKKRWREIGQINGHVIGNEINKCMKRREMSISMGWKGG